MLFAKGRESPERRPVDRVGWESDSIDPQTTGHPRCFGAKPLRMTLARLFANRKRLLSVEKPRKRLPRAHCYERRRHARYRNAPRDGPRGHRRSRRPRGLPDQHRRRGLLLGTGTSRDAVGSRLTAGMSRPRIARATPNALRRPRTAPIQRALVSSERHDRPRLSTPPDLPVPAFARRRLKRRTPA